MAETTKRARSPSPSQNQSGSEAKRAKEQAELKAAAAQQSSEDMAERKEEEVDAVDLGLSNEAEDSELQNTPKEGDDEEGEGQQLEGDEEGDDSGQGDAEGPSATIAIRALIVTGDASVIIGKQGKHINEIRDKSGAKLTIVSFIIKEW